MSVYVIGPVGGPFKIGKANNVPSRLSNLQCSTWHELTVVAEFRGNESLEHYLHGVFSEKRIRGEWFDLNESDFIKLKKEVKNFHEQDKKERTKRQMIANGTPFGRGTLLCGCGGRKNIKSARCQYCYLTDTESWGRNSGDYNE